MHMIRIACAAVMIGLAPTIGSAGDIAQKLVAKYEQVAHKAGSEFDRCWKVLKGELNGFDQIDRVQRYANLQIADTTMRQKKCFDKYSNLAGDTFVGDINPNQYELPRVAIVSKVLLITIPTLDQNVIENVGGFILGQVKKAVMNWSTDVEEVIIDLRNNPGGSLQNLDSLLELFAPEAGIRSREMDIKETALNKYRTRFIVTKARGPLAGKDVTFLVSKNTMSFAEWFVAILKYHWDPLHTRVLGDAATGNKDIAQCIEPVEGFRLKVTCAEWYTGQEYRKNGIVPDRKVSFDDCTDIKCIVGRVRQMHAEVQLK